MSFSADLKTELCSITAEPCCLKAEAFGLLLFGRSFSASEISFLTEFPVVANRYCELISKLTGVTPVIQCSKAGNSKITVESAAERRRILEYFGYSGKEISLRVNFSNFENTEEECCFKSFVRGAFLACGSISNPEKEYHLEFSISKQKLCTDLLKVFEEAGLKAKTLTRNGAYVLYCKEADSIEDFVGSMGATNAFLSIMQLRAIKTVKNKVNRQMNFESANMSRIINAGLKQVELIEGILSQIKPDDMTEDLAELCRIRLDNPELSLDDIGKLMSPPISRSAVSRRIKKLEEIAAELKER